MKSPTKMCIKSASYLNQKVLTGIQHLAFFEQGVILVCLKNLHKKSEIISPLQKICANKVPIKC